MALLVALGFGFVGLKKEAGVRKIAFVDTQRVLMGFKDANAVNKAVEAEDQIWKSALKVMEDSLKSYMDSMTVKYDKADAKTKKEMQDELSVRNQQINNFERVNTKKMQDLSREKLASVFEKINALLKEYGKARHFDVIFGTAQGSILYGEGTPADITDEIIAKLNQRYE